MLLHVEGNTSQTNAEGTDTGTVWGLWRDGVGGYLMDWPLPTAAWTKQCSLERAWWQHHPHTRLVQWYLQGFALFFPNKELVWRRIMGFSQFSYEEGELNEHSTKLFSYREQKYNWVFVKSLTVRKVKSAPWAHMRHTALAFYLQLCSINTRTSLQSSFRVALHSPVKVKAFITTKPVYFSSGPLEISRGPPWSV